MELTFKKLSNRWFIDIEYNGDIADLEMVAGADKLIESISPTLKETKTIRIVPYKTGNELRKLEEYEMGCTYFADTFGYRDEIWLCNVTKIVLGRFPEVINFEVV